MTRGQIVLLNGTSSAGKSTLARAVQEIMDDPYLHVGVDHFQLTFPSGLVNIEGDLAATPVGWEVVYDPEQGLQSVQIGPFGRRLITGMYRSWAALSDAGINLIADDVIWNRWVLETAVATLHDYPVTFIALDLSLTAAQQRESERGDRGPGNAAFFYDRVYGLHDLYDARIDVEQTSVAASAALVKAAARGPRTAWRRLWQRHGADGGQAEENSFATK